MTSRVRVIPVVVMLAGALAWLSVLLAEAQPSPMAWGVIPADHVSIGSFTADVAAAAVVLGSYGNLDVGTNFEMVHEEHHRVKLFREAGYDLATVEFSYFPGWRQRLEILEGQTFVPDGSGGMQRVPLQADDIFTERIGDRAVVRFTLPALQPGAIFEYRVRITANRLRWIRDWVFQHSEPTLWSEFRVRVPASVTLNYHAVGRPQFLIEEIDDEFEGGDWRVREPPRPRLKSYRWVMQDVPALREEPYVASMRNFAYSMRLAYAGYWESRGRRNHFYRPYQYTWPNLVEHLLNHETFGQRMQPSATIRTRVDELIEGASSEEVQAQRIYDFVRRSIVWSGEHSLYAARSLDEVLESGRGSSAEINLLLITLLREAGVPTDPVLISTRMNGEIMLELPSAAQLNHVIARISLGNQTLLLDATQQHLSMGMPSLDALNGRALAIVDGRPDIFRIEAPPSTVTTDVTAEVHSDGRISGIIEGRASGYPALELRQRLEVIDESDPRVVVDERGQAFVEIDGFRFTRSEFVGLEGDGDVSFELEFETDAAGHVMEHLLTFTPILFGGLERNPFQIPERTYPIDFGYPITEMYTARFSLPDGYELDELPANKRHATEGNYIAYTNMVTSVGGRLEVRRIYGRRSTILYPREYASIREVYDGITAADAGMIVLVKSEDFPVTLDEGDGGE